MSPSPLAPVASKHHDPSASGSSSAAANDRRREPRFACERSLTITPLGGRSASSPARTVGLLDCSSRGLGIVCDEPMVVGDQFVACLKLRSRLSRVVYTVRHCQRWERMFKIGAEMTSFIDSADGLDASGVVNALLKEDIQGHMPGGTDEWLTE